MVKITRRADLIDQLADLVVGADDPRRLAERTVEVVMSLSNGRSGAVFSCAEDRPTLFASKGIDQHVLDNVNAVLGKHRESLEKGETFYVPVRATEKRIPKSKEADGPSSFAVVPVLKDRALVAVLYVDSLDPHFCERHDLERLAKFSRIVAKAVAGGQRSERTPSADAVWETYLLRTPVEDMEREKLLLLLNRNEWNIARVARLMDVTRRTVYLRLARYKVARMHVPKGRNRVRPLAAAARA